MARPTRRAFLATALPLFAAQKGADFPSEWRRYADPATEFVVYRLTDPAFASGLPAYNQRAFARRGNFLLFWSGRSGTTQAFRMDLKTGEARQLTDAAALDPASITLMPDERAFCFFDGRSLRETSFSKLKEREIYRVPAGWERCRGGCVSENGFAVFGERAGGGSRLRLTSLRGSARTLTEARWEIRDPIPHPKGKQVLYRQGDEALWLINTDGRQNRRLKLADGRVGPANWSPDGKTVLYLSFPDDRTQLNAIREFSPEENTDRLVAKTSQFVHFGFNRDSSVFVGASRNAGSPNLLLLLRVTRRELTVCEHRATDPAAVEPRFSPDSRRVYFTSDRHGKSAIYFVGVERFVEET